MKRIKHVNKIGQLCITTPAPKEHLMLVPDFVERYGDENGDVSDESYEDHVRQRWADTILIDATEVEEIEEHEIPKYFRDAWKHCPENKIRVCMDTAREIHMNTIRAARDEALKKLDIETMKGNDVQAEKQKLRDIPQTFDLTVATTPEELKDLWPEELK